MSLFRIQYTSTKPGARPETLTTPAEMTHLRYEFDSRAIAVATVAWLNRTWRPAWKGPFILIDVSHEVEIHVAA